MTASEIAERLGQDVKRIYVCQRRIYAEARRMQQERGQGDGVQEARA